MKLKNNNFLLNLLSGLWATITIIFVAIFWPKIIKIIRFSNIFCVIFILISLGLSSFFTKIVISVDNLDFS